MYFITLRKTWLFSVIQTLGRGGDMEELLGNIAIFLILILAMLFIAYVLYLSAVLPLGKPNDLEVTRMNDGQDEIVK